MRKINTLALIFVLQLAFIQNSTAQETNPALTLEQSFEELKAKSADYEQYQVVTNTRLNNFWLQISDTLKTKDDTYQKAQNEISQLNTQIKDMDSQMAEKDKKVADSQYLVDHLKILGISVSKNGYVYFNFFLILALAAVIGIGFGRFKENERIASEKNCVESYKPKSIKMKI